MDLLEFMIPRYFRYLTNQKSGITYVLSHNYKRIKMDWYDSLPLGKTLTFG